MSNNATQDVGRQLAVGVPLVGCIVAYSCIVDANSPPPDGWLLCDGSPISRETYKTLFDVIGTLHGAGDRTTTFNLPDYRGRFLRGVDDGTGRDPDANSRQAANPGGATGDTVGSVQGFATALPVGDQQQFVTDDVEPHTHGVRHLPFRSSWYKFPGSHYAKWNPGSKPSSKEGDHKHSINDGGDADTCPVNLYVHYLIYYGTTS